MGNLKKKRKVRKSFPLLIFAIILVGLILILVGISNLNVKDNGSKDDDNNSSVVKEDEKDEEEDIEQDKEDEKVEEEEEVVDNTSNEITRDDLTNELFKTTAKKVMFVAHPDDETLWGGNGLYNDKYLVVCLTCGVVDYRVKEFKTVMNVYKDDYIMLSYPDLVNGKKSDWKDQWSSINKDINTILSLKNWDSIVTHNPDGEYGHIHHRYTSALVTSHADRDKLMYFGKYYYGDIPNSDQLYYLTDEEFNFKTKTVLPLYSSQKAAVNSLYNMIHYENWISYQEWYGE